MRRLILLTLLSAASVHAGTTLDFYFGHPAVADKNGVIAPWYTGQNGQFDYRVRIAAETLKRYPWASARKGDLPRPRVRLQRPLEHRRRREDHGHSRRQLDERRSGSEGCLHPGQPDGLLPVFRRPERADADNRHGQLSGVVLPDSRNARLAEHAHQRADHGEGLRAVPDWPERHPEGRARAKSSWTRSAKSGSNWFAPTS